MRRWLKNLPPDIAALSATEREKLPKYVQDRWQEEKWTLPARPSLWERSSSRITLLGQMRISGSRLIEELD